MKLFRASMLAIGAFIGCVVPVAADPVHLGQFSYEDGLGFNAPNFHILNESSISFFFSLTLDTDLGEVLLAQDRTLFAGEEEPNLFTPDPFTFDTISSATFFGISSVDAVLTNVFFSLDGGVSAVAHGLLHLTALPLSDDDLRQSPAYSIWADVSPLPSTVPEPSTLVLMVVGGALGILRRRRT